MNKNMVRKSFCFNKSKDSYKINAHLKKKEHSR